MKKNRSEYYKKYWAEHKEKISEQRRGFYKEHREEILERNKKWLEENRDKWNTYQREYRAKRKLDKKGKV